MPNTTQSASWDFNPSDPVHLAATFSFDTEDTQDAAPVAAALAAIQARLASAVAEAVSTLIMPVRDGFTKYGSTCWNWLSDMPLRI